MAVATLYNYDPLDPAQITNELYEAVGADFFQLGTVKRAFQGGVNFEIWDDTDSNAVQLTEDVDYELGEIDTKYSDDAGYTVYTGVKILNVAYQACDLYITYKALGSYTDKTTLDDLASDIATLQANSLVLSKKSITGNHTVLDDDGFNLFDCDASAGDLIVTLSTLADSQDKGLMWFNYGENGGKVTVKGEGAETMNGDNEVYMMHPGDYLLIYPTATEWRILNIKTTWRTGMTNNAGGDWTNVHLGSVEITYDNLGGAGFTVGEKITEEISNNTGIITADSGTILKLKQVTGTGIFTNDREITGSTSAETADVDGNTKNQDTDCFHNMGKNRGDLSALLLISTDGDYDNSLELIYGSAAGEYAIQIFQIDTDNIQYQTMTNGGIVINAGGVMAALAVQDWYYEIIIQRLI